jgi:hypothetical protein
LMSWSTMYLWLTCCWNTFLPGNSHAAENLWQMSRQGGRGIFFWCRCSRKTLEHHSDSLFSAHQVKVVN